MSAMPKDQYEIEFKNIVKSFSHMRIDHSRVTFNSNICNCT